jgi:PAS domain S-box-containing protein
MMKEKGRTPGIPIPLRYYFWGVITGWTCLVCLLIAVVLFNEKNQIEARARAVAKTVFNRDRHLTTLFREVYLNVTKDAGRDPEASRVPLQVAVTRSDRQFALLTPYLAHPALQARVDSPLVVRSRMTSLMPTFAKNAPDAWEEQALKSFETGSTELADVQPIDNIPYLRFISALTTEQSCLHCHTSKVSRLGEILGAVSIAVPLEPFWSEAGRHTVVSVMTLTVLWVFGLGGLQVGNRRLRQRIAERDRALEERLTGLIERKRLESALARHEEQYRRIVDTTQEGIWEIDAEGKTTFVNQPMSDMFGYAVEEMMGRSMYDFMDEPARLEAEKNLERRRQHVAEQHDFRFRKKNGLPLWTMMSTTPIFDEAGQFRGALAMVMDITERKWAEETLEMSERLYRSLFDDNLAGVLRTTIDGKILACNNAAVHIFGYSSTDDLEACRAEDLYISKADRENFVEVLMKAGGLRAHQMRVRRKDGEEVWVLSNVTLIGDIFHATLIDISEQRRAEGILRETEARLKLERMRMQISADLHDEIGSILSGISVFNEILRNELTENQPKALQLCRRVEENVHAVQESLHEIIWTINPENDSLDNVLIVLQSRAAELLEARGIRFEFRGPDEPVPLGIPMEKRRQVYLIVKEALNNLVKYSSCELAVMAVDIADGRFVLSLSDNGKGFIRGHVRAGNGIRNMEVRAGAMGGDITLDSAEGKGTTVTLRLPLA